MTTWDGTGVDPWLPQRLAHETALTAAERRIYASWWGSFSDYLVKVRRGVLAGVVPDPNAVYAQTPAWAQQMTLLTAGPIKDTIGLAYQSLFGPDYLFDSRPSVANYLAEVESRLVRTPLEVFDAVAGEIAHGAGAGESIPKIAARVEEVLSATGSENWPNRATVIARTETIGALNFGREDSFHAVAEELGGEFMHGWLATIDKRVRPAHLAADMGNAETGQIVPLDQPFLVGGELLMRPGDPSGSAANVIQCRCSTLLLRPGEEQDLSGRGFKDADAYWARQVASSQKKTKTTTVTGLDPNRFK